MTCYNLRTSEDRRLHDKANTNSADTRLVFHAALNSLFWWTLLQVSQEGLGIRGGRHWIKSRICFPGYAPFKILRDIDIESMSFSKTMPNCHRNTCFPMFLIYFHQFPFVCCYLNLLVGNILKKCTYRNQWGSRTGPPPNSTAMEDFDDEAWTRTCQLSQLSLFASTTV